MALWNDWGGVEAAFRRKRALHVAERVEVWNGAEFWGFPSFGRAFGNGPEWGREWCLSLRRWLHPNRRKNWVDTIFEGLRMKLFQTVAVIVRHRSKCFWDRI